MRSEAQRGRVSQKTSVSKLASAFIRAPALVLPISTCFLNITIAPKPRATYTLGCMRLGALGSKHPARDIVSREMPIEGGYTESTSKGRNPNRPFMAHWMEWLAQASLGRGGRV